MNLVSVKCPNCGGSLIIEDNNDIFEKIMYCQHCGNQIIFEQLGESITRAKVKINEFEHLEKMQNYQFQHEEVMKDKQFKYDEIKKENEYNRKKSRFIRIIVVIFVVVAIIIGLIFIPPFFTYKNDDNKSKYLQDIEKQIEILIEDEDYNRALIKANKLFFDGNDEKIKKQWDDKRNYLINTIEEKINELEKQKIKMSNVPLSSEMISGMNYNDVISSFKAAEFTNIKLIELSEIDNLSREINQVEYISINGELDFKGNDSFPSDSEVFIYYYSENSKCKLLSLPVSSSDCIGRPHTDIVFLFMQAGFTNIKAIKSKKDGWFQNNKDTKEILIDGEREFNANDFYEVRVPIYIYYYTD